MVTKTDSVATVVEAKSSLYIVSRFFYCCSSNLPLCLHCNFRSETLWMISPPIVFFVSLVEYIGVKVSRMCSCVSSFLFHTSPCLLNFFDPIISACCVVMMWSMLRSSSSLVIFCVFSDVFMLIFLLPWFFSYILVINLFTLLLLLVRYTLERSSVALVSCYSFIMVSLSSLYIVTSYGMSSSGGSICSI